MQRQNRQQRNRLNAAWTVIPGELAHSRAGVLRGADFVIVVGGIRVSCDGIFTTLKALTRGGRIWTSPSPVEFAGPDGDGGDVAVWVECNGGTVLSQIQSGSVTDGEGEIPTLSSFEVWFPFDVGTVDQAVVVNIQWLARSTGTLRLELEVAALRDAAARAVELN